MRDSSGRNTAHLDCKGQRWQEIKAAGSRLSKQLHQPPPSKERKDGSGRTQRGGGPLQAWRPHHQGNADTRLVWAGDSCGLLCAPFFNRHTYRDGPVPVPTSPRLVEGKRRPSSFSDVKTGGTPLEELDPANFIWAWTWVTLSCILSRMGHDISLLSSTNIYWVCTSC